MKKLISVIASMFFLFAVSKSNSQGLNNQYALDSVDVENALKLLGLEVYKFPLRTSDNKKTRLNYVIETYQDGKLIKTFNVFESFTKNMPAGIPESAILSSFQELENNDEFLRFYCQDKAADYIILQPTFKNVAMTIPVEIDSAKFGSGQYRAMNVNSSILKEKTPLLVRYSHYKDKKAISCPGDAKVADIVNLYGSVIVFYADPKEEK